MALVPCRECGNKVSSEATACPACGASVKAVPKKAGFKSRLPKMLLAVAVGAGLLALVLVNEPESKPAAPKPITVADLVKVVRFDAQKGGFNNVLLATFTLKNENPFPVKDMQFVCGHFAPSGTELPATTATLYERIEPGKTRTFTKVNFGLMPSESTRYNCQIAVVTQVALK